MEVSLPRGPRRPREPGWMPLRDWANLTDPPCDWDKALDFANPKSKRTAKMFDPRDVDRRSNKDIWVCYQAPHPVTGFRRPRMVPRKKSVHEVREGQQLEV